MAHDDQTRFGPLFEQCEASDDAAFVRNVVVTRATEALAARDTKGARPPVIKPVHGLAPVAVAGLVFVALAPLPAPPVIVDPPGTTRVQLTQVEGLSRIT